MSTNTLILIAVGLGAVYLLSRPASPVYVPAPQPTAPTSPYSPAPHQDAWEDPAKWGSLIASLGSAVTGIVGAVGGSGGGGSSGGSSNPFAGAAASAS